MNCVFAGHLLPAADSRIHIEGINFEPIPAAAHFLGRENRGSRTAEEIEHDIAPFSAVAHCIANQRDGLDGGMSCKITQASRAERVDAGIGPNIRPRTAMTTELDVIQMRARARAEHGNLFMRAAVKAALASVGLSPDTGIDVCAIDRLAGLEEFAHVAPIHAHIVRGHRSARRALRFPRCF